MKLINLIGKKFGRLTVMKRDPTRVPTAWVCKCACGKTTTVQASKLKTGNTTSCKCYRLEGVSRLRHGFARDGATRREYRSWQGMKDRCYNPKNKRWDRYGGRGIKVCKRWLASFDNFIADMGPCPKGQTIERKDNDGDYTPKNCCWATRDEQTRNKTQRNQWN